MSSRSPLRVGIAGPVGSGKTTLVEKLCQIFRSKYDICVITNDIFTKEDARLLHLDPDTVLAAPASA